MPANDPDHHLSGPENGTDLTSDTGYETTAQLGSKRKPKTDFHVSHKDDRRPRKVQASTTTAKPLARTRRPIGTKVGAARGRARGFTPKAQGPENKDDRTDVDDRDL